MRVTDVLSMAFLNLWRRKFRAFLTVLGMVIGVASIVVMVSLGIGIREATVESFAGTGSLTTIRVNRYSYRETSSGYGTSTETDLNSKSVQSFGKLPGVTAVMPLVTASGILKSGQYVSDVYIAGIDLDVAEEFGITLGTGEFPTGRHGSKYELAVGCWTFENFYSPTTYRPAIDRNGSPKITESSRMQLTFDYNNIYGGSEPDEGGQTKPKGAYYGITVTGTGDPNSNEFSYYSFMELTSFEKLLKENKDFTGYKAGRYDTVLVKCADISDVKAVKAAIEDMGFGTYSLQDAVEMAEQSTQRVQYLLGAIGGVALLVAAIGITNTMMMSIFERTREIGIIKVLGCRIKNIAALFLTESAFIGLFGGALGLGISYGISFVLNRLLVEAGLKSIIPLYLSFGAVGFSILVALLAGLYPSIRAMRLSPLAAIRNE